MDTTVLIDEFECNISKIKEVFRNLGDNFFFTEKELHSYFYHLCISSKSFTVDNSKTLIHTEYPTPFKCSIIKDRPYFKFYEDSRSIQMRSHIDLVLINPNFVKWIRKNGTGREFEYLSGVRNQLFSEYIKDFIEKYESFFHESNESIFLYALEFKYFRHKYSGIKYPIQSIIQDIEKLKYFRSFKLDFMAEELPFCQKTRSLVFLSKFNEKVSRIDDEYLREHSEYFEYIIR